MFQKGYKMSDEHKRKIGLANSIALKGKKLSEEHKRNISIGEKGKIMSDKSRKKLSQARKGMKFSEEHRKNLSKSLIGSKRALGSKRPELRGENSRFWKGGVSKELYGRGWTNILKESIRLRDNYKCQICGVPQEECCEALSVHHKNEIKTDLNPDNLESLCRRCHQLLHYKSKIGFGYRKDIEC